MTPDQTILYDTLRYYYLCIYLGIFFGAILHGIFNIILKDL